MNGVVIGGTESDVGKTVATLAVIRALSNAGYEVQPAKAGPDFIDPSHHEVIADRPSRTLDQWLQGSTGLRNNYHRGEGDICLVEGMMGLYDGEVCSTAMVAEELSLPVILVVDANAGMESIAATAYGFHTYATRIDRDIDVVGIIAQRAHGGPHEVGIRDALPEELAYLGRIPPTEGLEIPDRHLGLHMGEEAAIEPSILDDASEHIEVDTLVELTRKPREPSADAYPPDSSPAHSHLQEHSIDEQPRIAVALDSAFCFYYPATLERLEEGAEVITFAPTDGEPLPACDGVYLPGGYPERHAQSLSESQALETLASRATDGLPVFGECGGFMVLARTLTTENDETYEMAGVLPAEITMEDRYQAVDHVELEAQIDTLTASEGTTLRGHEFHYSRATMDSDARFAFSLERGKGIVDGKEGLTVHNTLGTYAHFHPESGAFDRFLAVAAQ